MLDRNPGVRVVSDEGSAGALGEVGADVEVVHDGDELTLGGLGLRVVGRDHAVIHPDPGRAQRRLPGRGAAVPPGDALTEPGEPVEVLAVPAGAPWLLLADAVDYLRRVGPRVAVPVHEKVLSEAGIKIHYGRLEELAGKGTTFGVLDDGKPVEL